MLCPWESGFTQLALALQRPFLQRSYSAGNGWQQLNPSIPTGQPLVPALLARHLATETFAGWFLWAMVNGRTASSATGTGSVRPR